MDLHAHALEIVARYKKTEAELLEILEIIDRHKVFLQLGHCSMFDYAARALGLAEGTAYNFINVMRKTRDVPELGAALASGTLTVAKARKVTSVLTRENHESWLAMASSLSQHALEKEVAKASPAAAVRERAKHVAENRVALGVTVSEEIFQKLKHAQNLESKRQRKAVNLEGTLAAIADAYLYQNDPVQKAERGKQQFSRTVLQTSSTIPAATKNQVYLRDQGRCQFKGCTQARWTEIHHIKPRRQGGTHALENLQTLCSAHHKLVHSVKCRALS